MIPKRNLGGRHVCQVCSTRFYDLNREEVKCPKCGEVVTDEAKPDPRMVAMARLKADGTARKAGGTDLDLDDADLLDDDELVDFSEDDDEMDGPEGEEDEEPISEDFE